MSLSLSEISTVAASFREDLRAYSAAGFDGIGIWEMKLGDDEADLEALRASGLRATNCVPAVPSILPNAVIEGPDDVGERIEALCASLHRFAREEWGYGKHEALGYDDLIRVRCWVRDVATRRIVFGYAVEHADTGRLLATATVSLHPLDAAMALCRLPDDVARRLVVARDPVRL